ncbi:MAG: type IV pilus assembly protein PilM [Candidatus Paceibacterota bacterium]
MFNFIKSLVGGESHLGVDIGTTSIKIAEISTGKVRPRLKNYGFLESHGHLERLNDAIQTNSLKIAEKETAELLKLLLAKLRPGTDSVSASIPSFSAFITLIDLPKMSDSDTAKTVSFQLDQYIPLPVSEVTIEWFKVGEKSDDKGFDKQEILIISIPNEQIKRYQNVFKLAGLRLKSLEVESLSLIRSVVGKDPTPTLLVDIGARSTNMAVSENGLLRYNYQTDFSGGSLTQAIASGLSINPRRAEELKRQRGLLGGRGDYELSTLIFPFLDAIINEAKRACDNYNKNNERKIERVVLSGGGASLLGIDKYFEKQINLPTAIGNPFSKIDYPPAAEPFVNELGPSFSVAIGLGLREFV